MGFAQSLLPQFVKVVNYEWWTIIYAYFSHHLQVIISELCDKICVSRYFFHINDEVLL